MRDTLVTLDGKEYTLRLTFNAINSIEQRTGKGVIPLLQELAANRPLTFGETVIILHSGIRAVMGNDCPPPQEIGEKVIATGIANLVGTLTEFMMPVVLGDNKTGATDDAATEEAAGN